MAGVVMVPYSAHGHVNPMLPVAAELVGRGVPVRMLAGGRFSERITQAGAVPLVPPVDHEVRVPARWRPVDLAERTRLWLRRRTSWQTGMSAYVRSLNADPPDVVVADPMVPWALRAARRLGIPVVRFCTTHARPSQGRHLSLVNCLPELQPRPHRFGPGFHWVGPLVAPDEAQDAEWAGLSETSAPVLLVSPGTVFARSAEFFANVVRQFRNSEWLVVLATGHTPVRAVGRLPDNVIARQWLPQRQVLRHATAFVTHGGMNSVQEAILHGVPMAFAPRRREQRQTASAVVALGAGLHARQELRDVVERMSGDEAVQGALGRLRARAALRRGAELAADQLVRPQGCPARTYRSR